MAAALLDHEAAGRVKVSSAGSQPADRTQPGRRPGHGRDRPRHLPRIPQAADPDQVQAADVVITMGCGDACPVYPGKQYLDWELPDPAGLSVEQVRPIRDEIARRVAALVKDLDSPSLRSGPPP